ncbi:MAG: SpoIIE family protein phosphatase [Clostridiales bacterium]|nr:SpoIIE family protein phosphatase [Clostridiales bacterium]
MKIGKKLILSMLALTLCTMLLVFVGFSAITGNLRESMQTLYEDIRTDAEQTIETGLYAQDSDSLGVLADMQMEVTDSRLRIVSDAVMQSAEFAEKLYASPSNHTNTAYSPVHLSKAPGTLSARYMFSAGVKETDELYKELKLISNMEEIFAPIMRYNSRFLDNLYVGTSSGIFYQYTDNNVFLENYVVTQRHWYLKSLSSPDEIMWKETEIDSYGRPCITASKAIKDPDGKIIAVVAADVNFEQMMSNVIGSGLGETGTTFLLGATRDLLAYSSFMKDVEEHNGLFNAFEDHFTDPENVLKKIDECAFGDGEAFHAELDGREIYMTARRIPSTGWLLCTAKNAEEITEPIGKVTDQSDKLFADARTQMKAEFRSLSINAIIAIIMIALIVTFIEYFISRTISKPIIKLTDTVKNTGEGDFDKKSDIHSRDEIGDLARGFNKMQDDLKLFTRNLKTVTAEKERISAELNVATKIQADMLPRIFPPFPHKKEIDIFASMTPAKEVGGDFYDFFLIDQDHLAMVIADVSGKGVPAALFMVISKTLIKNRAMQGDTPAQILEDVNNQLCEGNDADMFVTCWLGICDLSTGRMTAASAGHEFPVVCGSDRKFELLKDKHGFVLAGMEGMRYRDYEIQIERGGSIFVYTDGVPEATNSSGEMFGTDRMLESLNRCADQKPEVFVAQVSSAVTEFTGEASQFDDITMVGMTWLGKDCEEPEPSPLTDHVDTDNNGSL